MKVIIPNPENFEETKFRIKKTGYQNLHVLSDFDKTLTCGTIDGVKETSIISVLRNENYLDEGYAEKAHALFNKYHPIEVDLNISLSEKKKKMKEWWESHFELLVQSGLSRHDLEDIVKKGSTKFREGVSSFLDFLLEKDVPLVIFSASGCGDAIRMFFQKNKKDYSNIFYVINKFSWGENGKAIEAMKPIIHCANKDETVLKGIPEVYASIENRKNVILLGDTVDDTGMVEGFDYENLIKIAFLNYDCDKLRVGYEEKFDVILEGDGDFNFVNTLIQGLG